jgi:hypothetical protein
MAANVEWQTNIVDRTIEKIFALSDIHGDMHALIIALRDCAKVIKKKEGSTPTYPNKLDIETEQLLEYDLNILEHLYKDDLNYEWVCKNTHVVICGDILDGYRRTFANFRQGDVNSSCPSDTSGNTTGCISSEYPQIEVKIYRFINALNRQDNARHNNCRIHKILGNHEIWNMEGTSAVLDYIAPYTLSLGDGYFQGISRRAYFNYGNSGFDLIMEGGAGIFLKINNNIFVHGQLDHDASYAIYERFNINLNRPAFPLMKQLLKSLTIRSDVDPESGKYNETVSGRNYDRASLLNEKMNKYGNDQHKKCIEVKANLEKILRDVPSNSSVNINNIRVIVGHCPQSFPPTNALNSSFTGYELDGNIEVLSGNVRTGFKNTPDNFVFGIGMECHKDHLDEKYNGYEKYFKELQERIKLGHITRSDIANYTSNYTDSDNNPRYIYKVDVGVSRGFDTRHTLTPIKNTPKNHLEEKSTLGARVPQVLEIDKDDNIRIIRSTIKNMRIHQPRQVYETITAGNDNLNLENIYYNNGAPPKQVISSGQAPTISLLPSHPPPKQSLQIPPLEPNGQPSSRPKLVRMQSVYEPKEPPIAAAAANTQRPQLARTESVLHPVHTLNRLGDMDTTLPARRQVESIEQNIFYEQYAKRFNTTPEIFKEVYENITRQSPPRLNIREEIDAYIIANDKSIREYIDKRSYHMKYMKYKLKYLQLKNL